jgi:hypothetical protein
MSDSENESIFSPFGLCCYLVRQDQHTRESVRNVLRHEDMGRVWLTAVPVEIRGQAWMAFGMSALRDDGADGGWPILKPRLAELLSEGTAHVLELIVSPDGVEIFLSIFREGERQKRARTLPESDDPVLSLLDGADLVELPGLAGLAGQVCGPGAEAFFKLKQLEVPEWTDRRVDLFRFSERHGKGIEEEDGGKGGGRAAFIALDLEKLKDEVRGKTTGETLYALNRYRVGNRHRLLGPMQGDLNPCVDRLRRLHKDTALEKVPELLDLLELMALVHTWASTPGNRVSYLDEVFFPLLNLNSDGPLPPMDEDDREQVANLPLPHAMADLLPYACPEGEIMESFEDGEFAPLAQVLEVEGALEGDVEGAVWLLDHARLMERLRALDPDAFADRINAFLKHVWAVEGGRWEGDQEAWLNHRVEMDQPELTAFFNTANELQTLLEMCDLNGLRAGVLFYT